MESLTPELGTYFDLYVLSSEEKQVSGVDLRFQFDPEAVTLENIRAKKMAQFQWYRSQLNPQLGYAITAIMFPQSNQSIDLEDNDTLAVATFLRLGAERTPAGGL